ncbi:MAG: nucleoside triphosphate pyrophosphohydrolase [Clostridiaceae bacterium]|nr:nucleoside triphosphate pyrophosphohydrolase [Clostridiaceae bacterium]
MQNEQMQNKQMQNEQMQNKIQGTADNLKEKYSDIKENYSWQELVEIFYFLRSDQGCPWDQKQTHQSLRSNMIEEAYEAVEAIDDQSPERLKDELGDVLLQVIFHAQISAEQNEFTIQDVINNLAQKLIRRHTHIFGQDSATNMQDALETWQNNKRKEKGQKLIADSVEDIPKSYPALSKAFKVQKRAAKAGFDWEEAEDTIVKIKEELLEVDAANKKLSDIPIKNIDSNIPMKNLDSIETGSNSANMTANDNQTQSNQVRDEAELNLEMEAGDLLFAVVNYLRHLNVDPEIALNRSTQKFQKRFRKVEELINQDNLSMENLDLEQLDKYWDQAKCQI